MKFNIQLCFFAILMFAIRTSYSQYTERYKSLSDSLILVDSTFTNKKTAKGIIKETSRTKVYAVGEYDYEVYAGSQDYFYSSGKPLYKYEFDDFGNLLKYQYLDSEGQILQESEILKIDTKANNLDDFFDYKKNSIITTINSKYSCSKNCNWYLKKQGKKINGKKVGVWKTFSDDGSVIKEKNYD